MWLMGTVVQAQQGIAVASLPRADAWAGGGWFNQQPDCDGGCPWFNRSVWAGVGGGYYWTENHRTEVDLGATSEGRTYYYGRMERIDGVNYTSYGDRTVGTRRLAVMQLYQFRHNAWVHPFIGAGLQVVRERQTETRYRYPANSWGGPETMTVETVNETRLRPAVTAGLKGYVTTRAFVRSDVTVGFRSRLDEVTVRAGFGIDF
jgi:opacity protein-like surface antigen